MIGVPICSIRSCCSWILRFRLCLANCTARSGAMRWSITSGPSFSSPVELPCWSRHRAITGSLSRAGASWALKESCGFREEAHPPNLGRNDPGDQARACPRRAVERLPPGFFEGPPRRRAASRETGPGVPGYAGDRSGAPIERFREISVSVPTLKTHSPVARCMQAISSRACCPVPDPASGYPGRRGAQSIVESFPTFFPSMPVYAGTR